MRNSSQFPSQFGFREIVIVILDQVCILDVGCTVVGIDEGLVQIAQIIFIQIHPDTVVDQVVEMARDSVELGLDVFPQRGGQFDVLAGHVDVHGLSPVRDRPRAPEASLPEAWRRDDRKRRTVRRSVVEKLQECTRRLVCVP